MTCARSRNSALGSLSCMERLQCGHNESRLRAEFRTEEFDLLRRPVTRTGAIVLVLLGAALYLPSLAAAHGATSGEDDPCLRRVGERVVHFSAYQPQYELKDQYCTDIPKEGDTFLVVDLVDPSLRNEPV